MHKVNLFKQSEGHCGPASLKMVLGFYGKEFSEQHLAKLAGTIPDIGTPVEGLVNAAKSCGFNTTVLDDTPLTKLEKAVEKSPVIVNWFDFTQTGHYSVVIGSTKKLLYLAEPYTGEIRKINKKRFKSRWYDFLGDEFPKDPKQFIRNRMIIVEPENYSC
jgi:ABC-type bacteriocin/lantibiotic exporter with double-glycine peptidase domain